MMSIGNAICVLLAALLLVFSINSGHIENRKVRSQNAADAVTATAGTVMARGMNSVTATNHLIGEMLSFVILHEAVGGKKQEDGVSADVGRNRSETAEKPKDLKDRDRLLQQMYRAADAAGMTGLIQRPDGDIFELVHQRRGGRSEILAEATLLDSKMELKQWLIRCYQGLVAAAVLKAIPYTRAAGEALEKLMLLLERKIEQEYRTLKAVHGVVDQLLPVKQLLRDQLLPAAKRYTTRVVRETPVLAAAAAAEIGRRNGFTAHLFPGPGALQLPVQIDPLAGASSFPRLTADVPEPNPAGCDCPSKRVENVADQVNKLTQLARATFPWVNYHRKPIMDGLAATCQLARAKDYYFHWTAGYSKYITKELQEKRSADPDSHLGLYVLKGYKGPDKGYERWTMAEYAHEADDLFTVVGTAHIEPPTVIGKPIFTQYHPQGAVAYAMVLLYNGNQQQRPEHRIDKTCKRVVPVWQANVGMDTLNWYPGSLQESNGCETRPGRVTRDENRAFELLGIGLPARYPRVRVNWQSKLVPVTSHRLGQLIRNPPPGETGSILSRLPSAMPRSVLTH